MSASEREGPAVPTGRDLVQLAAEHVERRFGPRRRPFVALHPLDFVVDSTQAVGVVGESGSGKSTLARLLCGLDRPSAGRVLFNGADLAHVLRSREGRHDVRRHVQLVAQDTSSSFDPSRTLRDALRAPLRELYGLGDAEADARIDEVLDGLALRPEQVDRRPGALSGGQRQRVAIARALVVRPRLLLCDEVVSALDVSVQGTVLNLLADYCDEHRTGLLFVSHGLPATAFVSRELVVMQNGRIVEHGPTRQVLDAPQHPYTATLLAAHGRTAAVAS
ncbi:ABC transporter ATP-binding protein [Pseudonocardia pini]|uniref:ABC transporter ATP-binding protein n=1 Tax=Pseudonocardia pini TaxID=2758030 RepID=UPI0015F0D9A6|nr:ATP-binding cassette domain-containing protein [Pseudonocardia pini]